MAAKASLVARQRPPRLMVLVKLRTTANLSAQSTIRPQPCATSRKAASRLNLREAMRVRLAILLAMIAATRLDITGPTNHDTPVVV